MKKKERNQGDARSGDLGEDANEDLELFRRAMSDVVRIGGRSGRAPAPPVSRKGLEGTAGEIPGQDPRLRPRSPGSAHLTPKDRRLLKRLRRGGFPVEEDLDLHGLTRKEARRELESFLREAAERGLRCVRIVHGVGWNSPNRESVLRSKVPEWLSDPAHSALVSAFATARPRDGGPGAVYVLLRTGKERPGGREGWTE